MKKLLFRMGGLVALISAFALMPNSASAAADTCVWTGGGSDDNWSTAENWSGCDNGTVPEAGDTLEFPMTVAAIDRSTMNDFAADTSFNGIIFSGTNTDCTSPSYVLPGNSITLTGDINYNVTGACPIQITLDITAGANFEIINASTNSSASLVLGPPDGSGTFDVSTYDISFSASSSAYTYLNYSLAGSGSLTFSGPGYNIISEEGLTGFVGDITLLNGRFSFAPSTFGTTAGNTTVGADASLYICGGSTNSTVSEDINLTGGPSGMAAKLTAMESCGLGGAGDDSDVDPVINLSGTITLSNDVSVNGYLSDFKISGPLSGTGFKFTIPKGNDFSLLIDSSNNTSGISNGLYKSELLSTKYSGDQSSTDPSADFNQELVIEQGATVGIVTLMGGTLKGVGTVGQIVLQDGKVAPGLSPGCLTSGNLTYVGGTLEIEINGATECTEYDRQVVNGSVDLGTGTTLTLLRLSSYVPALNATYTIISNDGTDAVTGTFAGLAQGATTVVDGVTYTISYTGGDGNDVVLTVTNVAASVGTPNTGFNVLSSSVLTPILAIASGALLFGARRFALKK